MHNHPSAATRPESTTYLTSNRNALKETLPQTGRQVQQVHLRLGDALLQLGLQQEAKQQFAYAKSGKDSLLQSLAAERLQQMQIEAAMKSIDLPAEAR